MDPISAFILTNIAQGFIEAITDRVTGEIITKLQDDPAKKALKQAIAKALQRYATGDRLSIARPLVSQDSILALPAVANEISKIVDFGEAPNVEWLGKLWRDSLDAPQSWRNFTNEASLLIGYIESELKNTAIFRPVFEAKNLEKIADNADISAESLEDIENLLGSLISLIESQFGILTNAVNGASVSIKDEIRDFTSFIVEKNNGFIGRVFLFKEIEEFLKENTQGYFLLYGDPGIGKSAIAAKLVKEKGCIHHFNIRSEGINKSSDFLKSICSQLIATYSLGVVGELVPNQLRQKRGIFGRV
jgi:hypothetical protein